jgi:hypothetical protein
MISNTIANPIVSTVRNVILGDDGYTTTATDFDGSGDFYNATSATLGITDSNTITVVFAINRHASGQQRIWNNASSFAQVRLTGTDLLFVQLENSSGMQILQDNTSPFSLTADTWHTFLFSVNTSTSTVHCYLNDALQTFNVDLSDTIHLNQDWYAGRRADGQQEFNGCLAHFGFDDSFIDFSVEANRRKFFDSDNKPVNAGSDGSTAFGSQPIIWVPDGDFSNNRGSGGNFTENGDPGTCATSPTD